MSISHRQTASGRPLRVAPAWVGAAPAGSSADHYLLPVRDAVWIWSVRRFARLALWALPAAAVLYGWFTLGVNIPPGPLPVGLLAGWLATISLIALAGLLAGSRTRRIALTGLLITLAGATLLLPLAALPEQTAADVAAVTPGQAHLLVEAACAISGAGVLLLGWAVFRSKLVNPADGVLLMLAAVALGAGTYAVKPLPTVGALLLLAAGMGLAWTGGRLVPRA
jgi:Amt family ammonium transporter